MWTHVFPLRIFTMMGQQSPKLVMELATVAVFHRLPVILATQTKTENLSEKLANLCLDTLKMGTMWLQSVIQTVWNASLLPQHALHALLESIYQAKHVFLAYGLVPPVLMPFNAKLVWRAWPRQDVHALVQLASFWTILAHNAHLARWPWRAVKNAILQLTVQNAQSDII